MSVSGSTIQNNQATGSLTLPTGLSCSPTGTQTISLGTGGTGSASWSCTASSAGDYSNRITASVTATDSGTGGSLSDSEQTGLTVLSPASLTTSSTISSSSVARGSSVTFTVGVNNVGDSSTTFSISLDCPSGLSCSPSSVSSTSISGNSLVNSQFTVTGSTVGSYTITATVSSPVQSDLTTSKDLTVTSATATTSAPGGSSGSSGSTGATVETGKVTKTFTSITELTPKTITEAQLADSKSKLTEIYIAVSTRVTSVSITIEKLAAKPNETGTAPNAYEYIKITTVNLANISQAKIKFKVEKSWVSKNDIIVSSISLYRYTTAWDKLNTTKLSEDSNYYYFEAETPAFSYFAIGGEKLASTTTTTAATATVTTSSTTTVPSAQEIQKIPMTYIVIVLVIIVFIVLLIFFFRAGT